MPKRVVTLCTIQTQCNIKHAARVMYATQVVAHYMVIFVCSCTNCDLCIESYRQRKLMCVIHTNHFLGHKYSSAFICWSIVTDRQVFLIIVDLDTAYNTFLSVARNAMKNHKTREVFSTLLVKVNCTTWSTQRLFRPRNSSSSLAGWAFLLIWLYSSI